MPLPYVNASIIEVNYAVEKLGAVGPGLLTNHEGLYLGNADLNPFFDAVNATVTSIFVHPSDPYLRMNDSFVVANPSN